MSSKPLKESVSFLIAAVFSLVVVTAFVLIVTPWVTLGAINRLFGLAIDHNFWNYLYFWVILIVFRGPSLRVERSV